MNKRIYFWLALYAVLGVGLCMLSYFYFLGHEWSSLYGSGLHKLSRLHVLFVHFAVGCLLFIFPLEAYMAFGGEKNSGLNSLRSSFHHLTHITTLLCLYSGLTMELIERYPNSMIRDHLIGALVSYSSLVIISAVCRWKVLGKWRLAPLMVFVAIVANTSHIGGIIHMGMGFF